MDDIVRKLMEEDIDHEYTSDLVCPYCGNKESDSWEYRESDGFTGEIECGRCEKHYKYETHVDVTFSTKKIKEPDNE